MFLGLQCSDRYSTFSLFLTVAQIVDIYSIVSRFVAEFCNLILNVPTLKHLTKH